MAFETKPQTGALFANKVKKHPKALDYQGDLLVDTRLMETENGMMKIRLAGWKKQSASGTTFLSIAVDTYKPKEQQAQAPQQQHNEDMNDDDIPF
jgi:hypothetical protein